MDNWAKNAHIETNVMATKLCWKCSCWRDFLVCQMKYCMTGKIEEFVIPTNHIFFTKEPWGFFLKNEDIYKYIIAALCFTKRNIYLCRINVPMYKCINLKLQMLLDDCVSFLAEHKIFKQISWEHVQKCQIFLVKHPVLITSWLIEFF